jgi:hypothetical protein
VAVTTGPMSALRNLASVLAERSGLAALAGITFDGARDLFIALGYKRQLRPTDYISRYRRDALAQRIVEALPKETWRAGGELVEDEDPDTDTEFEQAWEELAQRLQVWPTFLKADILAGLGRFALVLIGAPGDLKDPLPDSLAPEDIVYLTAFGEDDITIRELDTDPASINFGMPASYSVNRIGGGISISGGVPGLVGTDKRTIVHASRCIHIADGLLTDRIFGKPRLEGVWNLLDDLQKVVGGGAEAFWRRVHQGYHFDLDKDLANLSPTDIAAIQQKAEDFANGFTRTMATKGMTANVFGSDVANFNPQIDSIVGLIAGSTGIPKRILMGSERGELASSQDRTNWNDRISDRRTAFAGPQMVHPFVDLLIERGALPEPKEYKVRWPEIQFLTEEQQATVAVQWSQLNKNLGEAVVSGNDIRDRVLGLKPLEETKEDPGIVADGRMIASATKVCEDVQASTISYTMGLGLLQLLGLTEAAAKLMLGPEADIPPKPVPPVGLLPGVPGAAPPGGGLPGLPAGTPPPNGPPAAGGDAAGSPVAAAAKPSGQYELVLDLPESLVLQKTTEAPRAKRKRVERDADGNITSIIEEDV